MNIYGGVFWLTPRKLVTVAVTAIVLFFVSLVGQFKAAQVNEQLRAQIEVMTVNQKVLNQALATCQNSCIERILNDQSERKDFCGDNASHPLLRYGLVRPGNSSGDGNEAGGPD